MEMGRTPKSSSLDHDLVLKQPNNQVWILRVPHDLRSPRLSCTSRPAQQVGDRLRLPEQDQPSAMGRWYGDICALVKLYDIW